MFSTGSKSAVQHADFVARAVGKSPAIASQRTAKPAWQTIKRHENQGLDLYSVRNASLQTVRLPTQQERPGLNKTASTKPRATHYQPEPNV